MKKIVYLLIVLLVVISCSKDDNENIHKTIEITINLSNELTYTYAFGFFEDDEGAEISMQATHFTLSEILRNEESGYSVYRYKPQSNYIGEDYVEMISERIIDTDNNKKEITTIKLTFTIL